MKKQAKRAQLMQIMDGRISTAQIDAILETESGRIAELEQALSEIERNAGKCVTLEQANWTIHKIKERSAAALGK